MSYYQVARQPTLYRITELSGWWRLRPWRWEIRHDVHSATAGWVSRTVTGHSRTRPDAETKVAKRMRSIDRVAEAKPWRDPKELT